MAIEPRSAQQIGSGEAPVPQRSEVRVSLPRVLYLSTRKRILFGKWNKGDFNRQADAVENLSGRAGSAISRDARPANLV
jgi:hypothetical protein